jgi:hypothetical protein
MIAEVLVAGKQVSLVGEGGRGVVLQPQDKQMQFAFVFEVAASQQCQLGSMPHHRILVQGSAHLKALHGPLDFQLEGILVQGLQRQQVLSLAQVVE